MSDAEGANSTSNTDTLDECMSEVGICVACKCGYLDIVELRLRQGVDPSSNGTNSAIVLACENGHAQIVQLLLTDMRVDPSVLGNRPLYSASLNGHADVVEILLSDPRVEVTSDLLRMVDVHPYARPCNLAYTDVMRHLLGILHTIEFPCWPGIIGHDIKCVEGGLLRRQLDLFEAESTFFLLLSVKRKFSPHVAARVGDVLREVSAEWTRFSSIQVSVTTSR
jgi:hypothetical protein